MIRDRVKELIEVNLEWDALHCEFNLKQRQWRVGGMQKDEWRPHIISDKAGQCDRVDYTHSHWNNQKKSMSWATSCKAASDTGLCIIFLPQPSTNQANRP